MTRPAFVRRAVAAAVLPLALGSLAACGGDDTSSASSASSGSSGSGDTPSEGETVAPADFVEQFQSGFENTTTAHESLTLSIGSSGSLTGEGDVDYTQDSPAMSMTMHSDMAGGDIEMRLVDGVMYMTIPGMAGGKYVKMDLNDPSSPFGSLGSQLDPQEALKTFGKGIKSVTYLGEEDGLGHYRVSVDTAKMLDEMGQAKGPAAALPGQMEYDVWLDDQDRVTKMTMDLGQSGSMEMELSDFGKDVNIEAPPADQVTDMSGMRLAG